MNTLISVSGQLFQVGPAFGLEKHKISWLVSMCHLVIKFWTNSLTYLSRLLFCPKVAWQISHLCGFFPWWTHAVCLFKLFLWVKVALQASHLYGFSSWIELIPSKISFLTWILQSEANSFFIWNSFGFDGDKYFSFKNIPAFNRKKKFVNTVCWEDFLKNCKYIRGHFQTTWTSVDIF